LAILGAQVTDDMMVFITDFDPLMRLAAGLASIGFFLVRIKPVMMVKHQIGILSILAQPVSGL
jgi:hypothetical protein